jgi:hypothetical protein
MKIHRTTKKIAFACIFVLFVLLALWLLDTNRPIPKIPANEASNQPAGTNQQQVVRSDGIPVSNKGVSAPTNAIATLLPFNATTNGISIKTDGQISASALKQIGALEAEKLRRTPVQQKIDSQLLYADKMRRGEPIAEGVSTQRLNLDRDNQGRILVDIKAEVTQSLLKSIADLGGNLINSYPEYRAIQAAIPLSEIENLAAQKKVAFIQPVVHAMQNSVDSEGDYTHQANTARANFGVNGTGVKIGVISDSVDHLSGSQIDGLVTVLPGQNGMPATGEGTAMLEIVNDLAPGAQLYFATAGTSEAQFASNIRNLRSTYGCDIIVDDELYDDESPFQDGIVAQAVNTVTASGALFFSSACNSGNQDDGTSGTWEGDFSDGGQAPSPLPSTAGRLHNFASGVTANTVLRSGPGGSQLRVDLFWSDPLGASTNDYDVYVLDSTLSYVVASSTGSQTGIQDPYEHVDTLSSGENIVIVKFSGAGRFLHLSTGRGELAVSTQGSTRGHDCVTNAFNVAATDAKISYPNSFTGGAVNPVETYSSDGPRRVFFQADGTPITAGNYSSSGGAVRQKPDITAADDVTTDVPGFAPFTGTSAAAPHAAAIAALLKSYNQNLTPSQIRTLLTNTALDIMSAGVDRDSGAGIVMALPALQQAPLPQPISAPASLAGKAIGGSITSGTYPWFDTGGVWLLIPASSGNSFQLITCATGPFIDISTASGTYSYSASGSAGTIQLQSGSTTLAGKFYSSATNFGNYSITNVSAAPVLADQTGEYEFFQAPALSSIAGKTFRVFIENGVSPFAQKGTSSFAIAATGNTYTSLGDGINTTNSSGTYSYATLNLATGQILLNDSIGGAFTCYLVFSSAVEGTYLATQASSSSFQIGHFVLVDTTKPSLGIQFPTAGARLTNFTFTAQGTATDDVQVAGVAYQLNTNGWAAATGSTNWSAPSLMPVPGTNTFTAYAVDTSGNISTTNQVSFIYILSALLTVQTNGSGSINPNYNGTLLAIGSNYTITATAGTGFMFTNWTGGTSLPLAFLTNGTTVQFVMQSNLMLQANFVDVQKPVLAITNLTSGQQVSNAVFIVKGTAGDNWQVSNVLCQINGGGWNSATNFNNWTNWAAGVLLLPGTNTVAAYAVDTSGNVSTTNSVSFQYVVTNQLQVRMAGLGTLSPNYSNAWLNVGQNYSMTASPGSGFVFTNWTISTNWIGGIITNNATVQFMMASNLTLQANFVDTSKPTLSITNLTAGQRVSNAVFTVKGTASDNWQVGNVAYYLNSGAWSNALTVNSWTNWSATVNLVPGTNTIAAYAMDTTGNLSTTNAVSFQYVVTNLLGVQATGLGTISPNYSNSWLEIGRNYSITATPGTGFVITNWIISTNWIGGIITNNATVQFMMASNLTLQVNFTDVTQPTLTITAPTAGQHMTNALATFAGTASDNWRVNAVWYQLTNAVLTSGTWSLATTTNGYTNWTTTVTLAAGTNTIKAYAVDLGGNYSATNNLSVLSSNTFKLQLAFTNALPLKTNGLFFNLQLSIGLNGQIQVSTNLTSWDTLTNFVGTNVTLIFLDSAATNFNRRFYRAVIP